MLLPVVEVASHPLSPLFVRKPGAGGGGDKDLITTPGEGRQFVMAQHGH